jgi:hypothetical protein
VSPRLGRDGHPKTAARTPRRKLAPSRSPVRVLEHVRRDFGCAVAAGHGGSGLGWGCCEHSHRHGSAAFAWKCRATGWAQGPDRPGALGQDQCRTPGPRAPSRLATSSSIPLTMHLGSAWGRARLGQLSCRTPRGSLAAEANDHPGVTAVELGQPAGMTRRPSALIIAVLWAGVVVLPLVALTIFLKAGRAVSYPPTGRALLRVCAAVLALAWLGYTGLVVKMHRQNQGPPAKQN